MPLVLLGNHAALDKGDPLKGQQVTSIHLPDTDTHRERIRTITHDDGLWKQLATDDAVWVASDDDRLAQVLAAHFACPVITMDEAREKRIHAERASELGIKPEDLTPSPGAKKTPEGSNTGGVK